MNTLEKKKLLYKIVEIKSYVTAKEVFLTSLILFPDVDFKSPAQIGKYLEHLKGIKFKRAYKTTPKLYYISIK